MISQTGTKTNQQGFAVTFPDGKNKTITTFLYRPGISQRLDPADHISAAKYVLKLRMAQASRVYNGVMNLHQSVDESNAAMIVDQYYQTETVNHFESVNFGPCPPSNQTPEMLLFAEELNWDQLPEYSRIRRESLSNVKRKEYIYWKGRAGANSFHEYRVLSSHLRFDHCNKDLDENTRRDKFLEFTKSRGVKEPASEYGWSCVSRSYNKATSKLLDAMFWMTDGELKAFEDDNFVGRDWKKATLLPDLPSLHEPYGSSQPPQYYGYGGDQNEYVATQNGYGVSNYGYGGAPDGHRRDQNEYRGAPDGHIGDQNEYVAAQNRYEGSYYGYGGAPDGNGGDQNDYVAAQNRYEGSYYRYGGAPDGNGGDQNEYVAAPDGNGGDQNEYGGDQNEYVAAQNAYEGSHYGYGEAPDGNGGNQNEYVAVQNGYEGPHHDNSYPNNMQHPQLKNGPMSQQTTFGPPPGFPVRMRCELPSLMESQWQNNDQQGNPNNINQLWTEYTQPPIQQLPIFSQPTIFLPMHLSHVYAPHLFVGNVSHGDYKTPNEHYHEGSDRTKSTPASDDSAIAMSETPGLFVPQLFSPPPNGTGMYQGHGFNRKLLSNSHTPQLVRPPTTPFCGPQPFNQLVGANQQVSSSQKWPAIAPIEQNDNTQSAMHHHEHRTENRVVQPINSSHEAIGSVPHSSPPGPSISVPVQEKELGNEINGNINNESLSSPSTPIPPASNSDSMEENEENTSCHGQSKPIIVDETINTSPGYQMSEAPEEPNTAKNENVDEKSENNPAANETSTDEHTKGIENKQDPTYEHNDEMDEKDNRDKETIPKDGENELGTQNHQNDENNFNDPLADAGQNGNSGNDVEEKREHDMQDNESVFDEEDSEDEEDDDEDSGKDSEHEEEEKSEQNEEFVEDLAETQRKEMRNAKNRRQRQKKKATRKQAKKEAREKEREENEKKAKKLAKAKKKKEENEKKAKKLEEAKKEKEENERKAKQLEEAKQEREENERKAKKLAEAKNEPAPMPKPEPEADRKLQWIQHFTSEMHSLRYFNFDIRKDSSKYKETDQMKLFIPELHVSETMKSLFKFQIYPISWEDMRSAVSQAWKKSTPEARTERFLKVLMKEVRKKRVAEDSIEVTEFDIDRNLREEMERLKGIGTEESQRAHTKLHYLRECILERNFYRTPNSNQNDDPVENEGMTEKTLYLYPRMAHFTSGAETSNLDEDCVADRGKNEQERGKDMLPEEREKHMMRQLYRRYLFTSKLIFFADLLNFFHEEEYNDMKDGIWRTIDDVISYRIIYSEKQKALLGIIDKYLANIVFENSRKLSNNYIIRFADKYIFKRVVTNDCFFPSKIPFLLESARQRLLGNAKYRQILGEAIEVRE